MGENLYAVKQVLSFTAEDNGSKIRKVRLKLLKKLTALDNYDLV